METSSISVSSLNLNPKLALEVRDAISQLREKQLAKVASRRWQVYFLAILLTWVVGVSMYDVYWSFKTQDVLIHHEENPIGTMLIEADNGDIALFMTLKTLGNIVVLISVPLLFLYKRSWGMLIASGLAVGQLCLFLYLNWGHLI